MQAAKDIETTAAECCQDTVLAFREMALGNMEGAEALVTDAAQSMADRLKAVGDMAGGWDPSVGVEVWGGVGDYFGGTTVHRGWLES